MVDEVNVWNQGYGVLFILTVLGTEGMPCEPKAVRNPGNEWP